MESASKPDVFIVEPRLVRADGHEFEHALEFARAVKARSRDHRVIVLSGPQDHTLTEILSNQSTIDRFFACFPERWLGDGSSPRELISGAIRDGLILWRALRSIATNKSVLFFDSLDVYRLVLLAVVRCLPRWWAIEAMGIMRYDPLNAKGELKRKYRFLTNSVLGQLVTKVALTKTQIFTDSSLLREVFRSKLAIQSDLSPIPMPGVWQMQEPQTGTRQTEGTIVAFIGQPRSSRGFDLFVLTALAMEQERRAGTVLFLVVTPHKSLETWHMGRYRRLLEYGLPGVKFEEQWMNSLEFAQQMKRADIVWALADPPDFYLRQTSGIFAHGFALGKRMIANRGGWAETAIGSSSACRYVEPVLDQTVAAVQALAATKPNPGSLAAAEKWRGSHSQKAFDDFVARILVRVETGAI